MRIINIHTFLAITATTIIPQSPAAAGTISAVYTDTTAMEETDCIRSNRVSGGEVSCSWVGYYHDPSTQTFYRLDSDSTAAATGGSLKVKTSLAYAEAELYTETDDDGLTWVYSSGPDDWASYNWTDPFLGELAEFALIPHYGVAYASAGFEDNWTIAGGLAGTVGTLRLTYGLDGSQSSTENWPIPDNMGVHNFGASSYAYLQIYESGIVYTDGISHIGRLQTGTGFSTGFYGDLDVVIDLELDFVFGVAFDVNVILYANSSFYNAYSVEGNGPAGAFFTFADFFNTASLLDFSVFDGTGDRIAFNLVSASGAEEFLAYSLDIGTAPSPVPLPAGFPLLFGAAGALGMLRLRRRNASGR